MPLQSRPWVSGKRLWPSPDRPDCGSTVKRAKPGDGGPDAQHASRKMVDRGSREGVAKAGRRVIAFPQRFCARFQHRPKIIAHELECLGAVAILHQRVIKEVSEICIGTDDMLHLIKVCVPDHQRRHGRDTRVPGIHDVGED